MSNVDARYNPYEHSSDKMLNDQFSSAYKRPNLVTVKMIVPVSEDKGTFRAKYSKDAIGWTEWKSGIVACKIALEKEDFSRNVYLSRYAAPIEIIPNSEVAKAYKEYLDGTDVYVPWNVVSPDLREELVKAGVNVSYEDVAFGKTNVKFSDYFDTKYSDRYGEAEVNQKIIDAINKVLSGDYRVNEKIVLKAPNKTVANRIKELTGIDVSEYKTAIELRQIKHILSEHGVQGKANRSMKDINDIAKIEYAIDNPDSISPSDNTTAYTSNKNGRNVSSKTVLFAKQIGKKTYYVVEAIPQAKSKTLFILTAFIGENEYKKTLKSANAISPDKTPNSEVLNVQLDNTTLSEKSQEEKLSDRDYSANIDSAIAREYGTRTNEEFKALVEKARSEMVKDTESNDNFANVESSIDKVIDWLSERYDSKAQLTDDAKNLLKEIRSTRVHLNEQQKQEVKNRYGSYGKYVQSMFGRMGIADNARVAIDTYYDELSDKHPELFDKNANSNEIPLLMSEAIDRLQNTFDVRDTDVNMQRDSMFNDIFRMISLFCKALVKQSIKSIDII